MSAIMVTSECRCVVEERSAYDFAGVNRGHALAHGFRNHGSQSQFGCCGHSKWKKVTRRTQSSILQSQISKDSPHSVLYFGPERTIPQASFYDSASVVVVQVKHWDSLQKRHHQSNIEHTPQCNKAALMLGPGA
eukprot:1160093-Pelagomonas_calceolata.AAC.7